MNNLLKRISVALLAVFMSVPAYAVSLDDIYIEKEGGNITVSGESVNNTAAITARDKSGEIIYIDLIDNINGGNFIKEVPIENKEGEYNLSLNDGIEKSDSYLNIPKPLSDGDAMVISGNNYVAEPGTVFKIRMYADNVQDKNCRLLLAVYGEGERLINVSGHDSIIQNDSSGECYLNFTVPDIIGAKKLKIFVLDDAMKPYFTSVEFNIKEDYIYVSCDGDDNAEGTEEAPFKTIEHALIAAYLKGSENPVSICLKEGEYFYPDGLEIDYYNNIRIRAMGDNVRITGGTELDNSKFTTVTDSSVLNKIPASARGKVVEYDLGAEGYTGFGGATPRKYGEELVPMPIITMNKREMTNARWPNDGFAKIVNFTQQQNLSFVTDSMNVDAWPSNGNACIFGYWCYNWAPDTFKIASKEGNTVTVDGVPTYGAREGAWYYVYNLIEELDVPGEWYIDADTDILYVYPYEDITDNSDIKISFNKGDLITINNCNNVSLEGIKISDGMGRGVYFKSSENCNLKGCELSQLGKDAVKFTNTVSCGVLSSDIHDVAGSAVYIDNCNIIDLKDSKTTVENCRIYNYAKQAHAQSPAIELNNSVGVNVRHNEIFDGPTAAISQLGHYNHIEYNKIHDVCKEASDYGAIYTYHTYYSAANTINYNEFYNIIGKGDDASGSTIAIYFDEMAGGCEIYGNIIRNTDLPYLGNGGRRITFENNIITDISEGNDGMSLYMYPVGLHSDKSWENTQSFMKLFPVNSAVYLEKFPELANEMNDMPRHPKYITFRNNVIHNHGSIEILNCIASATGYYGQGYYDEELGNVFEKNEIINEDLGFVDEANGNYTLREDSVIFSAIPGFERIDYSLIGVYSDEYRAD